jgi:hypothetical protein
MPKAYAVVTYRLISDPEKLAAHAKLSLPALATMVTFWSPGVAKRLSQVQHKQSALREAVNDDPLSLCSHLAGTYGSTTTIVPRATRP